MKNILLSTPRDCYITLTNKCNMRCRHCYGYYGDPTEKEELTGKDWRKIIKNLKDNEIFFVNISGGEPTVHPDFCEIIDALIEHNLFFLLTTNGVFNNSCLQSIIKAKDILLGIKISLDGHNHKTHSYLRLDANCKPSDILFDTTLSNIKIMKENNLPISIATCLHPENIYKLNEMKRLILEIKPQNWFISTIALSGRAKSNYDLFVSEAELPKGYWLNLKNDLEKNEIETIFVDMPSLIKSNENKSIYFNCPAARSFCDIYSNGKVTPCPLARVHMGSFFYDDFITKKSLKDIWQGKNFSKFRELQHKGCLGCKARKICDRCIPQSIQWFDNPKIPPPYCIKDAEALKLKNRKSLVKKLESKITESNRKRYLDGYTEQNIKIK